MEEVKKKIKDKEFIIETPLLVEENINNGEKIRKYERGKFLGKGGFAKCYEIKCLDTNKIYAAKVFEKNCLTNPRSRKKLVNEIKIHKKLHHNNIVNFEHFFEDRDNVYVLLELCSNQTLNELVKRRKRLTEIEVQCYLVQIIKALKYLHAHRIIHRDLKLGNCFLTNKLDLKLGDFGLAAKLEFEGQRRRTVCGTPNYIAPEILEKRNGHSFEVDIWSLGVVAYTLLCGKPPFETDDVKLTYKRIKVNSYSFPENIKIHSSAKKLISSILNLDPSKRPTLDQILEQEFFKNFNSIPVVMPLSTLACPPSQKFIIQYNKNEHKSYSRNNSLNLNKIKSCAFGTRVNIFKSNDGLANIFNDKNNVITNSNEDLNNKSNDLIKNILKKNVSKFKPEILKDLNENNILEKVNNWFPKFEKRGKNENYLNSEKDFIEKLLINEKMIDNFQKENFTSLINLDNSLIKKLEIADDSITNENLNICNSHLFSKNLKSEDHNVLRELKIIRYFDYTAKFGIIYYIGDIHFGIIFNDNSNILKNMTIDNLKSATARKESKIHPGYIYIEKDAKNLIYLDEESLENLFKTKDTNKEILNKFDIFKHFIKKHCANFNNSVKEIDKNKFDMNPMNHNNLVYVKNFMKVQNAFMFRLSNKIIQICFFDKSELILSTENDEVKFSSKGGHEIKDKIENIMSSGNDEIIKRIKYAKNLLIHFVKNQKNS